MNYSPDDTVFADICLDFDGVIHSYASGWQGADVVSDPPVNGAINAIYQYLADGFTIAIYSARSNQDGGINAMRRWLREHDTRPDETPANQESYPLDYRVQFPKSKPSAKIYIDDRGFRFEGVFPDAETIRRLFTTWNK